MKYLLLSLFLLTGIHLKAQTTATWPPVYEIKTDSVGNYVLDSKYWQLLVDTAGSYGFEQVTHLKFKPAKGANTNFKYNTKVFWTRYRIKNTLANAITIFIPKGILATNSLLARERGAVYTLVPGKRWERKLTGSIVPWSQLSGFKRINGFYYTINPGEVYTFYEQTNNDKYGQASVRFNIIKSVPDDMAATYERLLFKTKGSSFFLGFTLLTALVCIFFYYAARERVYLYFGLINIFLGISSGRLIIQDSFFREYPEILKYTNLMGILALHFLWHFVVAFYRPDRYFPRWTKFSYWLSYSLVLLYPAPFITLPPQIVMILFVIAIFYFINLVVIVIVSILKNRDERFFNILTILPFFLSWILIPIISLLYVYDSSVGNFIEEWGMVPYYWLVLMFLLKLILRYKILQQKIVSEALEREKQFKENEMEKSRLIALQKVELEEQVASRTAELNESLLHLKQTQSQLIQSEKMASLGELTAGIAHEIQNPLNFVNNFSEVSIELLTELREEVEAGNQEDVLAIADDLTQNLDKIHHHGKRADSIVKGMLEHSRKSTGQKEPTDLNKLADEYLRLAYHGLRAKDKSFNAELITNFDQNLPLLNIMPQDIGRVLLNLFSNAFYATQQKQKKTADEDYKPTIAVTTLLAENNIFIKVKDNGTGIADAVKNKILQPFFTTKPTGEGTGLGLSLSYDIVVKSHGGNIAVNSTLGEGAEFVIQIPIT